MNTHVYSKGMLNSLGDEIRIFVNESAQNSYFWNDKNFASIHKKRKANNLDEKSQLSHWCMLLVV